MRIMQPRIGFALVGAALLATGATSMAVAAQTQAQQPACYSTCPPEVELGESFHVLHVGAEEIERFFVRVEPGVVGAEATPTGSVTIKAGSTVLCTIILVHGRGSCSPSASALPAGHDEVVAYYSGDSTYSPAQSHPRQLQIIGRRGRFGGGGGGGGGIPGGFGSLLSFLINFFRNFLGFFGTA